MMYWWCIFMLVIVSIESTCAQKLQSARRDLSTTHKSLTTSSLFDGWSLLNQIGMTTEDNDEEETARKRGKVKKKLKRFILPLLLAYKLKFFALIPLLVGGLLLLTASTGLAGFFFALFAASMGLKTGHH
ncbi:hypothetical protein RN001_011989 [Aquatica leii]|uniref:Uncharacterized protein n=1 Tax=Aquatica leii TaxID=1421715 RepID=A0AAN7SD36_9COLE|nr:hypothetical protein RN001_011989 [Aquatica leii]